jgi:hypothetical protein
MRKLYKEIMLIIIISILISHGVAIDNESIKDPVKYRILIDQKYGFFRSYKMQDNLLGDEIYPENRTPKYQESRTLNISKGDTVTFVSDVIPGIIHMTIVSKEKLWSNKNGTLLHSGKEFSYTFNNSGIYNIYIKEHYLLTQRIIVGPIDINSTNEINVKRLGRADVTKTPNLTDTKSNSTIRSDKNNTDAIQQNETLNKSTSVPISVMLTGGLFSKIKSKSDTSIFAIILFGIYVLSGRIKDV